MKKQQLQKTQGFEQLLAWQKAQDLAVYIYELTKDFPSEEKFALTSQIRRAVTSVSANIAEGYGRRSAKDKIQFYTIGYGSLLELKSHLHLAVRLGYLQKELFNTAVDKIIDVQKLINALISSIRRNDST
ncbi:MAG: four helix bundle protein [Candidatus Saccharimonadales bacterium]